MSRDPRDHEARDLAELYVLGVLDAAEAAEFEVHLAYGCPSCQSDVAELRLVLGTMALSAPRARPPRSLRDRVLARMEAEASGVSASVVVRAPEGQWETVAPGVTVKYLFHGAARVRRTMLMRIAPGIRRAAHRHAQTEEIYVLEGELRLGATVLRAGDYSGAAHGTLHPETQTDISCLCLCFAGGISEPTEAGLSASARAAGRVVVRAEEGAWQAVGAGVTTKRLFSDAAAGTTTSLVRMPPGVRLPVGAPAAELRHPLVRRPAPVDEIFVLAGSGHMGGQLLWAGDYFRAAPASRRDVTSGATGCTLFMLSSDVGDSSALPLG